MSKAFTLIELLMVTAIIMMLTALLLSNYRSGDKGLALQRSASKLSQDLRRSQEMAMSSKRVSGAIPYGFGIYFNIFTPGYYILFADLDGSRDRNSNGSEDLERAYLESGIVISGLSPVNIFSIVFSPPDPTVWINGLSSGVVGTITLSVINGTNNRVVSVNNAGLIYAQ